MTSEVDGFKRLIEFHNFLEVQGVRVGCGHAGNNFVFYDLDGNLFNVWSELSPSLKDLAWNKSIRKLVYSVSSYGINALFVEIFHYREGS
ncbi:hypothetical protein [Sporosarcina sp. ACRSL]|uniref:hypothetical protein n=1 Tax=Sporosarcina sp. ACRSL TaxID=2918215 RepID=UPI00351D16FC